MLEGLDKMSEGGSRVAGYASHASLTVIENWFYVGKVSLLCPAFHNFL